MAQRFEDLLLRRKRGDSSAPVLIPLPGNGAPQDFSELMSSGEIEELVDQDRAANREAADAFTSEQAKFSTFDQGEAPKADPTGNTILDSFIKGTLSKSPERIETFEEFFDKRAPATHMLSDAWRGMFDSILGRETRSTRDRLFKEFQVETAAKQKRAELEQRNELTAIQLAAGMDKQKNDIQMRMELAEIETIENAQERADARIQFALKYNLDLAEHNRRMAQDDFSRQEKELNRITDSKVPLISEMRTQVASERPDWAKSDPEGFNKEVMDRYEAEMARDMNRQIAIAKAKRKGVGGDGGKFNPTNTSPQRIELLMENVLRGEMSLPQARMLLVGENKDPEAFFKMMEMGEGRIIRNAKVRTQLKTAADGMGMASQLKSLALEARKSFNETKEIFGDRNPDVESESFQGLKADLEGAFQRLTGAVGDNAAATVFDRLIPGFATTIARAGGETGRISDADVARFIKQAPKLSDTLKELDVLEREITKTIGRTLISSLANEAPTMGRRQADTSKAPIDFNVFMHQFRSGVKSTKTNKTLKETFGTNDPVEVMVLLWEQGREFTF